MRFLSSGDATSGLRKARETVIALTSASLATSSSVFLFFVISTPLKHACELGAGCSYRPGEAAYATGNAYTLFSIASVVLGGVSLMGGKGSAIGAIFGALAFRTIGDLLFVFDFDPLWQPLFQGVVLLLAVCLSAFGLLRIRNRLEWFG